MQNLRCFLFLMFAPLAVLAQNMVRNDMALHGQVVDQQLKTPLPYCSIGIPGKPIGTVSDSLGHFELTIPSVYDDDSLQVSLIGFNTAKLSIRSIVKQNHSIIIDLTRRVMLLKEVVVLDRFTHIETTGRKSDGRFMQASIIPKGAKEPVVGSESGVKVQAKHYPALLDNINFYVSSNNFKYVRFRVNVYSLKNNLPDTLLLGKEILVTLVNYKTGWNKVDLAPYDIVINRDIAITLQWVDYNKDMATQPQILIPVGISLSHINYFRTASQDKWNSIKGNSSFFTEVKY
ncbi:MAG: carboxypeptidase-like regulatory domain-containing protein [Bacteroidetes bacterium]|nr:carboxypeptidase-like regulatory domain-containing protein [Bacteroidota bacterium]